MEYDIIIVGSGFGGSVAALRLAEKGYRVAVVEQGKWFTPEDMNQTDNSFRQLFWMPAIGATGFFLQSYFRHVTIVGSVGVGGGSLGYAAVLLRPKSGFYTDPAWSRLGIEWEEALRPHYETASRMLGVESNPYMDIQDDYLKKTAEAMGSRTDFGPTPNGIYFGEPEIVKSDPFFGGIGPARTGCRLCGKCLTGCPHDSKNSLDRNYLYLAQRLGAVILPHRKVNNIIPLKEKGYQVEMKAPGRWRRRYPPIKGRKIIVAAGVLGTLELLFHCRDVTRTLPNISSQLGKIVRTNSEAVVGVLSNDPDIDLTHGTTISSHFFPDTHTHITQNRFPKGYTFMKWFMGPLVDDHKPLRRALVTLLAILAKPLVLLKNWLADNWHKRITILTVMQHLDNQLSFDYGRSAIFLFLKRRLKSKTVPEKAAPTNLPVANRAAEILARESGGEPLNVLLESIANISTTAHILGGCHMGRSSKDGVIDTSHELFGHPGIYIMSGAAVSANIGANPSLTIAAMTERAVSLIPAKEKP